MELSRIERDSFARLLWSWYRRNARALPWRGIYDPYRTWLSEIMLQQTRVSAVVEHYARFVERFPTLVALALAPLDDVLAAWSGLGYYRRARLMHRTAKLLMEEHGGSLPSTSTELRRLPGIGIYTSAAIASIAYGERIAVVDHDAGTVERAAAAADPRPARDAGRGGGRETQHRGAVAAAGARSRRPQPGHDGAGRNGLPASRSTVRRLPGLRAVPHPRRASDRATQAHAVAAHPVRSHHPARHAAALRSRCCCSAGRRTRR